MEEIIIIKGEFNKPSFLSRALGGLIYGVVIYIVLLLVSLFIPFLNDPIIKLVWMIMCFGLFPLAFGFDKKKLDQELLISDKRIYAKTGKNVIECPVESVTNFKCQNGSVIIQAPPRKIYMAGVINFEEIGMALNSIYNEKQTTSPVAPVVIKESNNYGNADELKKYKELLDMGAITQEEFDAKKKQLLDL